MPTHAVQATPLVRLPEPLAQGHAYRILSFTDFSILQAVPLSGDGSVEMEDGEPAWYDVDAAPEGREEALRAAVSKCATLMARKGIAPSELTTEQAERREALAGDWASVRVEALAPVSVGAVLMTCYEQAPDEEGSGGVIAGAVRVLPNGRMTDSEPWL